VTTQLQSAVVVVAVVVVIIESHKQAYDLFYSAIFLYFHSAQTSSRDQPASYQWVLGPLSPGVEQPEHKSWPITCI